MRGSRRPLSVVAGVLVAAAIAASFGTGGDARGARNVVVDPGFEAPGLGAWSQCGSVKARISTAQAHRGTHAMRAGSTTQSSGEIDGDAGLCQQVRVPADGVLTFWVYAVSSARSTSGSYQEAEFLDDAGNTVRFLWKDVANTGGWKLQTVDVSPEAGRTLSLYFGVHGDGSSSSSTILYVDDVSLTAGTPAPTATPLATPLATPSGTLSPTPVPTTTASATFAPTATPSGGPTAIPSPSGGQGASCGTHCGTERWHTKTMSDPFASQVNLLPQLVTVDTLIHAPVPTGMSAHSDNVRFAPWELQAVRVRATIVGWKTEADNDYHIVIADLANPNETMIVEPPSSACSGACTSGYGALFQSARDTMVRCFGQPPAQFTPAGKTVVADVTGIPYFDPIHGQTGVAPNGIEIHPVVEIVFVSGC